uniref:Tps10 n=1 Tax=Arundo donax TaxID=35708 RepID=A0A0A8ZAL0_ARUDO
MTLHHQSVSKWGSTMLLPSIVICYSMGQQCTMHVRR